MSNVTFLLTCGENGEPCPEPQSAASIPETTTIGAVVGTCGAFVLVKFLTSLPTVNGLLDGVIPPIVVVYGIVLAMAVGLFGGLVPAVIASRMTPTTALRQE